MQICIEDIAHALSHICRFTGHSKKHYSVAQHCVHTSYLVPPEHALAALLHDAPEAYINDIAKPLKMLLPDYQVIEDHVENAVFDAFSLPLPLPACVKHADLRMLIAEQKDIMGCAGLPWADVEPLDFVIAPLLSVEAKSLFLQRYGELIE